jgi:hypothetical protein
METIRDLPVIGVGTVAGNTVRIAALWLATSLMVWNGEYSLSALPPGAVVSLLIASSLTICGLGCAATMARSYLGKLDLNSDSRVHRLFTRKISQAGCIGLEILTVLACAMALRQLLG